MTCLESGSGLKGAGRGMEGLVQPPGCEQDG